MYVIVSQFTLFFKAFALYILVFMCYNVYIKRDAPVNCCHSWA